MKFFRKLLAPLNILFSVSFAVRCARSVSQFFLAWLKSRSLSRLLLGLIPVSAAGVLLWSMLIARVPSHRERLLDEYLTAARGAVTSRDVAQCRINFRRAIELANGSSELRFEYATSLFQLGEQDEAIRMLSGMAPLQKSGYLPAHRFLSEHYQTDDLTRSDLIRAIHLGHLIRQSRDNREDRQRLLALLVRHRSYDRAEKLLRDTLDLHPEDRLTLVRLKAAAGQPDQARREAELAVESLKLIVDQQPRDADRRIQLAQAHVFLGQFSRAVNVLTTGLLLSPDEPLFAATSKTCDHWLSLLDDHERAAQMKCLHQLLLNGSPQSAATGIAGDAGPDRSRSDSTDVMDPDAASDSTSQPFGDLLRTAFSSRQASLLLPFLVGTVSAAEGDLETAERNLREALRVSISLSPLSGGSTELDEAAALSMAAPVVCNNLAYVLFEKAQRMSANQGSSTVDPGSAAEALTEPSADAIFAVANDKERGTAAMLLAEALALSSAAAEQVADAAEFHETRGQILARMGRHEEAVHELNRCLELNLSSHAVHETLADSYSRLGRSPEALKHFELARRRRKGE
jgi:tetratricopeptide (TPR) repeat protein